MQVMRAGAEQNLQKEEESVREGALDYSRTKAVAIVAIDFPISLNSTQTG
jgi:hypothetical protein